jgi:hypothetical protein
MNEPRPEFVVVIDESKLDIPAFGVRTAEGTPHGAKIAERESFTLSVQTKC